MDFRTLTTRQALATLGACLALLVLASPASAVPDESDAFARYLANNHGEQAYHATRIGIPDSVAAALEQNAAAEPTVIPYFSHGIGIVDVDAGSRALLRDQPDGFQPQPRGVDSAPAVDSGFDWETTGFVAGGILAAMLLALMSTIALRDRRGLRSA